MENWKELLKDKQVAEFATCEGKQPRVRPMTLMYYQERFWMATGATDNKSKQLTDNPLFEAKIALAKGDHSGYFRISGKVNNIKDPALRKELADFSGFIYSYFNSSEDTNYVLYELLPASIRLMLPGEMTETEVFTK